MSAVQCLIPWTALKSGTTFLYWSRRYTNDWEDSYWSHAQSLHLVPVDALTEHSPRTPLAVNNLLQLMHTGVSGSRIALWQASCEQRAATLDITVHRLCESKYIQCITLQSKHTKTSMADSCIVNKQFQAAETGSLKHLMCTLNSGCWTAKPLGQ